jgi:photosystem II stability/assembly factor-like uncharacterized protein
MRRHPLICIKRKQLFNNLQFRWMIFALFFYAASILVVAQSDVYVYKNVKIGAGGFVTGIVYSMAEKDLLYVRTDVGGMYRWNASDRAWIPLSDFIGNENHSGVLSIAADPSDPNRVYMATGLYTASWSGNGAFYASEDKGNTWKQTNLNLKLGGNEDGRSTGERLQVDPNSGNILYLGTSSDGLWKSIDYGKNWRKVISFPVLTSPNDPGISLVLLDKNSSTVGNATSTIYVAVLQKNKTNFFKSTDSGNTWEAIAGAPEAQMVHRAALGSDGIMYLTYNDNPGPNGIGAGSVWKYNTITGDWIEISPPEGQGGFGGIDIDANNSNIVMTSTLNRWWPGNEIYRSLDGGTTWKTVLSNATIDNSSTPYVNKNNYNPHWIGDLKIDPFNSENAWFITGYGLYTSQNIAAVDNNQKTIFSYDNNGLEELVATGLISPPTGVPLLSTVGDQDGFRHTDLDVSPNGKFLPGNGGSSYIDFAQNNPDFVVQTYYNSSNNWGSYSTNQGVSWEKFKTYPSGANGPGIIAVAADGSRMVWALPGASTSYSLNNGDSWEASTGIPSSIFLAADRVNSLKFYGYDAISGIFYVSTDGGLSFQQKASDLPKLPDYETWMTMVKPVYGKEGEVWITCGYKGLYRSVDSGGSFQKITNVDMCHKVAFGKAPAGSVHPAIYIVGNFSYVYGFYQSIDEGENWIRINDDEHQFLGIRAFTADPNVFGRVYLGTVGRGIIYGQPKNETSIDDVNISNISEKDIVAYPNPFKNFFQLKTEELFSYTMYDISGRVFEKGKGDSNTKIGIKVPKGIYILKVISVNQSFIFKVNKQ